MHYPIIAKFFIKSIPFFKKFTQFYVFFPSCGCEDEQTQYIAVEKRKTVPSCVTIPRSVQSPIDDKSIAHAVSFPSAGVSRGNFYPENTTSVIIFVGEKGEICHIIRIKIM